MFREMRRGRQALSRDVCAEVLARGTAGVLALAGDDGYPYAVPLSYVYDGDRVFFHCAKAGHKLDAIRRCGRASFCVIDQDRIVPAEYTTYFRSVILFGQIRILEDGEAKRAAAEKLAAKYTPEGSAEERAAVIEQAWARMNVLELTVESMTGKEARELAEQRREAAGN